jgi:hypothetical protein
MPAATQTTPGWTPPQSPVFWFDNFSAADTNSGYIPDRSGNNYFLWQTNAAKRGTLVDGNCIQGNGSSSFWMFTNAPVSPTMTNITLVLIATPASAINKQALTILEKSSSSTYARLGLYRSSANVVMDSDRIVLNGGTASADFTGQATGQADYTNQYWLTAIYCSSNAANAVLIRTDEQYVYGSADSSCGWSLTNIYGNVSAGSTLMSFGQTYFSDSKIMAVMGFSCVLTSNELLTIKQHYITNSIP